jgi:hypothetical protein
MNAVRDIELDRLYGLPLAEFTAERDALAKRLRQEGDRDAAQEVKALRKPSVTAWALNQLSRHAADDLNRLLQAGERLRDAQARLIEGGDPGSLREAGAEERELVDRLTSAGEAMLEAAGHPASPATSTRLRATLHAAAGNDEARGLLAAGRLVQDYEFSDLGLGALNAVSPSPTKVTQKARPRPERQDAERKDRLDAERKDRQDAERKDRQDAERRDEKAEQIRQRLAEATRAQTAARDAAKQAERKVEQARQAAEQAQTRVSEAEQRAAIANQARTEAESTADEARERERAADKAVARLQAELEQA